MGDIEGVRFHGNSWNKRSKLKIPEGCNVLITHGPPRGILDRSANCHTKDGIGDDWLLRDVEAAKPNVHVFGHVHESYGVKVIKDTTYINAASLGGPWSKFAKI